MIRAVLFDLDDTLFPQSSWLEGAWASVANRAAELGLDGDALLGALIDVAALGSDRGRIINRALVRIGARGASVDPLVDAFCSHAPDHLPLFPGVANALARLASEVTLALVTDGDPDIQRAKLRALDLDGTFAVVVLSDELGRHRRKPDPQPFRNALALLGMAAGDAVFVGDRPDKDVAGAQAAGLRAVRVHTGEYAAEPERLGTWASVADVPAAAALLLRCARFDKRRRVN